MQSLFFLKISSRHLLGSGAVTNISFHASAPCSELPSNISTMSNILLMISDRKDYDKNVEKHFNYFKSFRSKISVSKVVLLHKDWIDKPALNYLIS